MRGDSEGIVLRGGFLTGEAPFVRFPVLSR